MNTFCIHSSHIMHVELFLLSLVVAALGVSLLFRKPGIKITDFLFLKKTITKNLTDTGVLIRIVAQVMIIFIIFVFPPLIVCR